MKKIYSAVNKYHVIFLLVVVNLFIFGSIFSYPSGDWLIINELINQKIFFYYNKNLIDNYPQIVNEGRYHILNGLHLNIAYLVFNIKTKIIFIGVLQAFTYLLFCYIILKNLNPNSRFEYIFFTSIVISQHFIYTFLHPSLEESIFSLIIALLLFILIEKDKKYIEIKISILLFLLILSKVTSIIIIVGYLLASMINKAIIGINFNRKISLIFICSAIFWCLLASNTNIQITGEDKERFIEFYRYLLLYLNSNPIIFIVILFTFYNYSRYNLIDLKKNCELYNFFLVGVLYFLALIAAGKHSQYHILPVIVCILPAFFISYKIFLNSINFSLNGILLLFFVLLLEFFYGKLAIIIFNLIFILYIALINFRKATISKILQLALIFNLLIIVIFSYKISFFSGQLIFYSYIIFLLIKYELSIVLHQALSFVLFVYACASLIIPGLITSYDHILNQNTIVNIATKIHYNLLKEPTKKNLIVFSLPEEKPEDEIIHAYLLAKTIKSVYGDSIFIMPFHCSKIPEKYESIRNQQNLNAASDFNKVVIPCLKIRIAEKNYSIITVNAHSNKFIGIILGRLHVFNPSQPIISYN